LYSTAPAGNYGLPKKSQGKTGEEQEKSVRSPAKAGRRADFPLAVFTAAALLD
jgi:hypothetical protein